MFHRFYVITMISNPIYRTISHIPSGAKVNPAKLFNRVFDNGELANNILENLPRKKQFVGTIPRVFFSSIKSKEIPDAAIKIRELFAEFTQFVNKTQLSRSKTIIEDFKNKLSKLIKQNIIFEIIGDGSRAYAFKLSIQDKEFKVKSFKPASALRRYMQNESDNSIRAIERADGHGGEIEAILAQFASHKTGTGILPRFNFGKVAHNNSNDGYMVSRYVKPTEIPQIKNIALLHIASPINFNDTCIHSNINHINGIVFDLGGAKLKKHYPNNRDTAKLIRKICQFIDKGDNKKFKKFLKQNKSNQKCIDAIAYIKRESRVNNIFKEAESWGDFTPQQQEIFSTIGIRIKDPEF